FQDIEFGDSTMTKTIERLIGENVKRHRTQRGWDQERLSVEINALKGRAKPLHRSAISHIETGERGPTVADITLIALALELTPGALLILPENDADKVPIDDVLVGVGTFPRDRIQMQGAALDPDSPAQYIVEIARDLVQRTADAQALVDKLDDLQSMAMTARV